MVTTSAISSFPLKPATKVQLRLAAALMEAGFTVERRMELGSEYLVFGYGQGALAKKLDSCIKKLSNKLNWSGHEQGIRAIAQVQKAYSNGSFL